MNKTPTFDDFGRSFAVGGRVFEVNGRFLTSFASATFFFSFGLCDEAISGNGFKF